MSLLSQYESSKHLNGFTLGFHRFFDAFKLTLYDTHPYGVSYSTYAYKWNDIYLSSGNVSYTQQEYIVKPCSCIKDPNPIGGYVNPQALCKYCGHQAVLGPSKKSYYECSGQSSGVMYSSKRDGTFIKELSEFRDEQLRWVTSDESQKLYKTNKRKLREECQRRINFFVQTLHTYFAGQTNAQTLRGTCDPYLRDIRNLAHLCLKE